MTVMPKAAVNLAQHMNPGQDQTNILQTKASDWISNDPDAALNWLTSVHDPALHELLIVAAAKAYATVDPALSARWLLTEVTSPNIVANTLASIESVWAAKDPAGEAAWEAQFANAEVL